MGVVSVMLEVVFVYICVVSLVLVLMRVFCVHVLHPSEQALIWPYAAWASYCVMIDFHPPLRKEQTTRGDEGRGGQRNSGEI